jgi:hypothetical protein
MGCSTGLADQLETSRRVGSARFAAISLTKDQNARVIISNVLVLGDGTALTTCEVCVSFFNADGSLIGDTTPLKLKAGEPIPSAAQPSNLVRSTIDVVSPAKECALRTNMKIFDVERYDVHRSSWRVHR